MLKHKSSEDLNSVISKKLFTELTHQEGEAIKGGYIPVLYIKSLQCFRETSGWGDDEISVRINGKEIENHAGMDSGDFWNIGYSRIMEGSVTISIYEEDGIWSDDDHIGSVTVGTAKGSLNYEDFFGDGSHYRLGYGVGFVKI